MVKKTGMIAVAGLISALLCGCFLCLMVGGNEIYTNAENGTAKVVVSAFAENSDPLATKKKITFDDSIWGNLARALEKAVTHFYG